MAVRRPLIPNLCILGALQGGFLAPQAIPRKLAKIVVGLTIEICALNHIIKVGTATLKRRFDCAFNLTRDPRFLRGDGASIISEYAFRYRDHLSGIL